MKKKAGSEPVQSNSLNPRTGKKVVSVDESKSLNDLGERSDTGKWWAGKVEKYNEVLKDHHRLDYKRP